MSRFDTIRRAVSLTLVVLCLLVVPQVASAVFSSAQTPTLSVGTAKLVAPTAVTGTARCTSAGSTEGIEVKVSGFSDAAGLSGTSYTYELREDTASGAVRVTTTTTATTATLTIPNERSDNTSTTWVLTISSKLGSWTGPAYARAVTCANRSTATTNL